MGWIHRARYKLDKCLYDLEYGWNPCLLPQQFCYCFVPRLCDLRSAVFSICIFQILTGSLFLSFALFVDPPGNVGVFINDQDVVEVSTVAISILKETARLALDYFDVAVAAGSIVAGVLGLLAASDRDGLFNYTDRAMIKIVIHMNASMFMAFLTILRVVVEVPLIVRFYDGAIPGRWWIVLGLSSFSLYHAFVVWSFYERLKLQCQGSFVGAPVVRGQRPPGLIVEFSHYQGSEILMRNKPMMIDMSASAAEHLSSLQNLPLPPSSLHAAAAQAAAHPAVFLSSPEPATMAPDDPSLSSQVYKES